MVKESFCQFLFSFKERRHIFFLPSDNLSPLLVSRFLFRDELNHLLRLGSQLRGFLDVGLETSSDDGTRTGVIMINFLACSLNVSDRHQCHMLSHFNRVRLFVTLWTIARQAPLSQLWLFSEAEHGRCKSSSELSKWPTQQQLQATEGVQCPALASRTSLGTR